MMLMDASAFDGVPRCPTCGHFTVRRQFPLETLEYWECLNCEVGSGLAWSGGV